MFFVFLGIAFADLLFLAIWVALGFGVDGDAARFLTHQIGGLMVAILTVFAHSVTFVYFLGTGLAVKEARRNWGIHEDYLRQTRRFKLKVYPIAMVAIGFTCATGILGGAARSGDAPLAVHRWLAFATLLTSAVAFFASLRFMLRNGYMMALIRGEVAEIKAAAARGEQVVLPGGAKPELLKTPEEVKKAPAGFLASRACLFLGISTWGLYGFLVLQRGTHGKWAELGPLGWLPFAAVSLPLLAGAVWLKARHPLPSDVDF
ncbi:MAG: hypothetical protein FJ293_13745 [Planctomycetes bacterium]|nr:hypothetical protein [Planctomycetota bacterium]